MFIRLWLTIDLLNAENILSGGGATDVAAETSSVLALAALFPRDVPICISLDGGLLAHLLPCPAHL